MGLQGEAAGRIESKLVTKDVKIYKDKSLKSKVIGQLKKCEKLPEVDFVTIVEKFGLLKITYLSEEISKMYKLNVGDTVDLIWNEGEGSMQACFGGNSDIPAFEGNENDMLEEGRPGSDFRVSIESRGKISEWAEIKMPNGKIGFVPGTEKFYQGHYDDPPKCKESKKSD